MGPIAGSMGRKRIVVVEDDPDVLDLEAFLLESEGYDVTPLREGRDAATIIKRDLPDVVLLDLMLPDVPGEAILEELATDPKVVANTRVIIVSALTPQLSSLPLVHRIVPKPFDAAELLQAVAQQIGRLAPPTA